MADQSIAEQSNLVSAVPPVANLGSEAEDDFESISRIKSLVDLSPDQMAMFNTQFLAMRQHFGRYWSFANRCRKEKAKAEGQASGESDLDGDFASLGSVDDEQVFTRCNIYLRRLALGGAVVQKYRFCRNSWPIKGGVHLSLLETFETVYNGPALDLPRHIDLADLVPDQLRLFAEVVREETLKAAGTAASLDKLIALEKDAGHFANKVVEDLDEVHQVARALVHAVDLARKAEDFEMPLHLTTLGTLASASVNKVQSLSDEVEEWEACLEQRSPSDEAEVQK